MLAEALAGGPPVSPPSAEGRQAAGFGRTAPLGQPKLTPAV